MAREDMNNPTERINEGDFLSQDLPIRGIKSGRGHSKEDDTEMSQSGIMDDQINAGCIRAIDEWRGTREQGQKVKEQHLIWLRKQGAPTEKQVWTSEDYQEPEAISSYSAGIEDITWQIFTSRNASDLENHLRDSWDEDSCLALDYAINAQDQNQNEKHPGTPAEEDTGNLSHIELDAEGFDAMGRRIRVQRMLEVKLGTASVSREGAIVVQTTMQLEATVILKKPHPFSLPPQGSRFKEPHHLILEQLAQHELDKAIDERNYFLREVFAKDVDHVRKRRESTFGAHDWTFHTPVIQIRGPDGVILRLVENRTDAEVDDEVVTAHMITLTEIMPTNGQSHLFDLPTEGSERERRIRQARWSISSAIDRCSASGSAERFVMDKWIDGSFQSR